MQNTQTNISGQRTNPIMLNKSHAITSGLVLTI